MRNEQWIDGELDALRQAGLDRHTVVFPEPGGMMRIGDRTFINFSSNDYLDFTRHPKVIASAENALRAFGSGAAASRLLTGTLTSHAELERKLADYKGYPAALVFGSGYMANVGTISALVGRNDDVFADRLAHASIIDAAILSRARLHRFRHNDAGHLDEMLNSARKSGRCLIVTESVFSMDGDIAPLSDIAGVAEKHGAMLMVDEAHATGVFGPRGSGLVRELKLEGVVNVSMGTLSKALGGYGGFVACSCDMRELLVNRARSFIYSTALPPSSVGAALGALQVLEEEPGIGARLLKNAALFRQRLRDAGLNTGDSASQIIPVIVGENDRALAFSKRLREQGIIAAAIRPPTVPEETARLRFSVTLAHSPEALDRAADVVIQVARKVR